MRDHPNALVRFTHALYPCALPMRFTHASLAPASVPHRPAALPLSRATTPTAAVQ